FMHKAKVAGQSGERIRESRHACIEERTLFLRLGNAEHSEPR
ncbi:MAG: hypothetical protein ACI841_004094, partial [Planctomycetota bacterium]